MLNTFDDVVEFLKKNNYKIKISKAEKCRPSTDTYQFAMFSGNNIRGGFAEPNNVNSYRYLDGRIAADHIECFDKCSKCPLCVKYPVDENRLLDGLKLLASDKGYEISDSYTYLESNPFPYDNFE